MNLHSNEVGGEPIVQQTAALVVPVPAPPGGGTGSQRYQPTLPTNSTDSVNPIISAPRVIPASSCWTQ